jgi:hypothetical protein
MQPPTQSRGTLKVAGKGVRRSANGDKRGPKWRPQQVTITTSYDEGGNDIKADDSDAELIAIAERDFKVQA